MTPEGRVKDAIKKLLKFHDVYWHMPVQNGMGAPTLDFICCAKGHYLAIEAKAPGKGITDRQARTALDIRTAYGVVFVVADAGDLMQLAAWLEKTCS